LTETILSDPRLYELLQRIDEDLAGSVRAGGCRICSGVLHRARYARKPRGGPAPLGTEYAFRLSFCCAQEGCRKRATPPSVRFLGRRVSLGAAVVMVTALRHGPTPWRLSRLREICGASVRTLSRWRAWFRTTFAESRFFKAVAGRFASPVARDRLPASLLERFPGDERERLVGLLRFLCPITTTSAGGALAF
jgi:hypothetical protein